MHFKQIVRTNPSTGKIERPWRTRDHLFVLADPSHGSVRHHEEYAVKVDNYGEALELVESRGFAIRMSDGKSPPTLVTKGSLTFIDEPVDEIDQLWTYTMPDPPFEKKCLEQDIRQALIVMGSDILAIADEHAANAFLGLRTDVARHDDSELGELLDLDRFHFAHVMFRAYDSVFRCGPLISDEDVDSIVTFAGAMFSGFGHSQSHPAEVVGSPLRTTMVCAIARSDIENGWFLSGDDRINERVIDKLGTLAGMSEQTVRNSMHKENLSTVKGKIAPRAILRWLENRRDFVPLREAERPSSRPTWQAISLLKENELDEAFEAIRKISWPSAETVPSISELENQLIASVKALEMPPRQALREYARLSGFNIDTFVLSVSQILAERLSQNTVH